MLKFIYFLDLKERRTYIIPKILEFYSLLFFSFFSRFNYRSTHHLASHGFYEFLNWFDERAWYPLGRIVGGTVSITIIA